MVSILLVGYLLHMQSTPSTELALLFLFRSLEAIRRAFIVISTSLLHQAWGLDQQPFRVRCLVAVTPPYNHCHMQCSVTTLLFRSVLYLIACRYILYVRFSSELRCDSSFQMSPCYALMATTKTLFWCVTNLHSHSLSYKAVTKE